MSSSGTHKITADEEMKIRRTELQENAEVNTHIFKVDVVASKLNHLVREKDPHLAAKFVYLAERLEIDRSKKTADFKQIDSFNALAKNNDYLCMKRRSIGNEVFAKNVLKLFYSLPKTQEDKFLFQFSYMTLAQACIGSILAVLNHPDYSKVNKSLLLRKIADNIHNKLSHETITASLLKQDLSTQCFFKHLVLTMENFYKLTEEATLSSLAKGKDHEILMRLQKEITDLYVNHRNVIPPDLNTMLNRQKLLFKKRMRLGVFLSTQETKEFLQKFKVIKMGMLLAIDADHQSLREKDVNDEIDDIEKCCATLKALDGKVNISDILFDLAEEKTALADKKMNNQSLQRLYTLKQTLFDRINHENFQELPSSALAMSR